MGYYTTFILRVFKPGQNVTLDGPNADDEFKALVADAKRYRDMSPFQIAELKEEVVVALEKALKAYEAAGPEFWEAYEYGGIIDGTGDSMKWYEHENDLHLLSKAYPEFVFQLDGEGEDHREGALFRKWFHRGQMQGGGVQVIWPELDQKEWKK